MAREREPPQGFRLSQAPGRPLEWPRRIRPPPRIVAVYLCQRTPANIARARGRKPEGDGAVVGDRAIAGGQAVGRRPLTSRHPDPALRQRARRPSS